MARILLEDIQKEAEQIGWKVISTKYTNLKTEMEFKCAANHVVITTYEKWRRAPSCPVCKENSNENKVQAYKKKSGDYRVLALDQSTRITGWSIFENNKLIHYGLYEVQYEDEANRINSIKEWLWNMIQLWQIDMVWLEDIQFQDNKGNGKEDGMKVGVTTYKALAHLQGVLINLLYSKSIAYDVVHVATWRTFNEIKGRTRSDKKKSAQLKVQERYGIFVGLDEAEAICIGRYGASHAQMANEMIYWG